LAGTTNRPPALEFIRVNRPASDMPLVGHGPPGFHPDFVPAVPTANQCRPRGFSPPRRFEPTRSSGFVAPQYRTGFAVFRTRPTRTEVQPDRDAPHSAIHTLRRVPLAGSRTASLRPLPPRRSPDARALGSLTTTAAFTHRCSTCASDPKTHPPAEWPHVARFRARRP